MAQIQNIDTTKFWQGMKNSFFVARDPGHSLVVSYRTKYILVYDPAITHLGI